MKLGLADPVVTDRFLLWTFAAACSFLMLSTSIMPILLGRTHPLAIIALAVFSVTGAATAACYWLAFFPPEAYRRRVRARAAAGA